MRWLARGFVLLAGIVATGAAFAQSTPYTPMIPVRLMDTRPGNTTVDGQYAGTGPIASTTTVNLTVLGRGGIPASGVTAVALNVTVTNPTNVGFITVWPAGTTQPTASNLNLAPGVSISNQVIAKVGTNNQVSIYVLSVNGSANVIVDVAGYFPATSDLTPLTPARLLDTRSGGTTIDGQFSGGGAVPAGGTLDLTVLGRGGVPASGVSAVVLNVTAVTASANSFVTVWPSGVSRPLAANLNVVSGQTIANLVMVGPGTGGKVSIYNNLGNTNMVVDVVGYFSTTATFDSLVPARLLDTRSGGTTIDGQFSGQGAIASGGTLNLSVLGRGGVPTTGVGAVALNITAVLPPAGGYLVAWGTGTTSGNAPPPTMDVNFWASGTVPSLVIAQVGPNGQVSINNSSTGATQVVADVMGWFPLIPKINGLGNDYEVYDFGSYNPNAPWYMGNYSDPLNNNWYTPAHQFKNPVYLYNLNPSLVQSQMRNMRSSGIDVLVLHMSAGELAACEANGGCEDPFNDGIWGFVTDVSGAALRPQQQQNLSAILNYAVQIGFRKVFLRFDSQDMGGWTAWNETEYQKMWNFIVSTHNIAAPILLNTATRLMVDLGGEQIGVGCPANNPTCVNQAYVQRLWSDYVTSFGTSDTVGFSFIAYAPYVQAGLSWYGTIKPNQYAFDTYDLDMVSAWQALGSESSKPIMIMETFSNDLGTATRIESALSSNPGLTITDVVQWPTTSLPVCSGCDSNIESAPVAALNTTNQATNYLPIVKSVAVDNLDVSLLNVDSSGCAGTYQSACVKFNVGYAPAGGNNVWQIWVTANNGARSYWSCNAGSWTGANALTTTFLASGFTYRFDYYKTSSCSTTPPLGSQATASYVTLR